MNLLPPELLEVGTFFIPHLLSWRRQYTSECSNLHKSIADLNRTIALQDGVIGQSKHNSAKRASHIKERQKLQKEAEILEWRLFESQKSLDRMKASLNDAIDAYARTCCLQLTTKMYDTLPRELRDLVYSYVLDPEDLDRVVGQVQLQLEREWYSHYPCTFWVPHCMDTQFVPPAVATEILATIADRHARSPLIANTEVVPRNVRLFLDMQALDRDVPISRFFCDLRIKLHLAGLLSFHGFDTVCQDRSQLTVFVESVRQLLLDIPAHPNRVLTVELWQTRLSGPEKKALRIGLFDVCEEMKTRGFKSVVVEWYIKRSSWLSEPKWNVRKMENNKNT